MGTYTKLFYPQFPLLYQFSARVNVQKDTDGHCAVKSRFTQHGVETTSCSQCFVCSSAALLLPLELKWW